MPLLWDVLQTQIEAIATFLVNLEAHMNILLITKVKILDAH